MNLDVMLLHQHVQLIETEVLNTYVEWITIIKYVVLTTII